MDKWEVYMKIKQLLEQGFKISNIARNLEVSRTTVYKYLENTPEEMAIWMHFISFVLSHSRFKVVVWLG